MRFEPGDCFFLIHKSNVISKVIAWFMKSKWSHTGLIIDATDLDSYTVETNDFGVVCNCMSQYIGDKDVILEVWRPDIHVEEKLNAVKEAKKTIGTTYGYFQLLGHAFRLILQRIGIRTIMGIKWGIVCNGVVARGYSVTTMPFFEGLEEDGLDTEEFYRRVVESKFHDGKNVFTKVFEYNGDV